MCESGSLFFCKATAGRYIRDPTNTISKSANSRLKEVLLQSVVHKLDREVRLTYGGQETAKELELGVEIVRRWFKERGDSILKVFCCELLRV